MVPLHVVHPTEEHYPNVVPSFSRCWAQCQYFFIFGDLPTQDLCGWSQIFLFHSRFFFKAYYSYSLTLIIPLQSLDAFQGLTVAGQDLVCLAVELQQGFSFPQMLQGENVPANLLQLSLGCI